MGNQAQRQDNDPIQALATAAETGDEELLHQILLKNPQLIDVPLPDRNNATLFIVAAANGQASIIRTLVRLGSRAIYISDQYCQTPLHAAAYCGQDFLIEPLLRLGSQALLLRDWRGYTPLHLAAIKGSISTIEELVRLGCPVDVLDKHGRVPLRTALYYGQTPAIEALIRLGSKAINQPEVRNGWTPLHEAAIWSSPQAVEMLIQMGSSIDTPDRRGNTALHLASSSGRPSIIEVLVRLGTTALDSLNIFELTPMQAALPDASDKAEFFRCVTVLRALGAQHCSTAGLSTDAEVLEVRYQVYFAYSLLLRCLFELGRRE